MNFSTSLMTTNVGNDLAIFTTKSNLTTRFADYSNVYLLPSICLFGMLTSLASLAASFKHDETNVKMMTFIFLNSLIDFAFLFIEFWLVLIRCGTLCPYGYTYFAKFFEIYIYLYVGYILVNSQVFLGIYVSIERLRLFSATAASSKKPPSLYVIYIPCLLLATILNAPPYLISKEVVKLGIYMPQDIDEQINATFYDILYIRAVRPQFQTDSMQIFLTVVGAFKDPFVFLVFCLINIQLGIKFQKYLNKRKLLLKTHKSKLT
jgi:hypothetical protein